MHFRVLLAGCICICAANISSAVEPATIFQRKADIYRAGWIDLNKNGKVDPYENPATPVEDRITDLLSQMTMDEKTCQMVTLYGYGRVLQDALPTEEWKESIWKDGICNIDEHLNGFQGWNNPPSDNEYCWPASVHAAALNEVQRFFIEDTRLGIPVDFTDEGIRGVEAKKATNFPTQLGIGHTWDRALVRRIGEITGQEARLLGFTNVYSPILDVGRDQRWGRMEEVYGEAPFLVAQLGVEMIRGIQSQHVVSTVKHFAVYGNNKGAREGMARVDPQIAPREVEMIQMYPFKEAFKEAGALGVMSSYNDYDGVPVTGSEYFLTKRLREDFGFKGYVISDSDAVEYLENKHGVAATYKDAVFQSVQAGLNVRCTFRPPETFLLPLRALIAEGRISGEVIDARVRDVLRVKFWLGLFDNPYTENYAEADRIVNGDEHRGTALQASRESLVLLKNQNSILPLDKTKIKTIAVCGPNADEKSYALTHYGPLDVEVTTVLKGIQNIVGEDAKVLYAKGCGLIDAHWPESEILPEPMNADEEKGIAEAVANARGADVAIVVVGGGQATSGENKSRTSLDLAGRQLDLVKAIQATGTPTVLILIDGRPATINWCVKNVPAILEAWYPGSEGGTAIAEALFGDYNPGGKLTVTFPKTVGQIPMNFPTKPNAQEDASQVASVQGVLYPFGYGLSYTTFKYSNLAVSPARIKAGDKVKVACDISNSGTRGGDEVVQMYTRDVVGSVTTYEKNLWGFERVHLEPKETKRVEFEILPESLQL
ncbi:MAG: glycoside hydrolase family 3 N-terminal domain-containing protein, partial [Candidatus Sumerlaeota bacterium]